MRPLLIFQHIPKTGGTSLRHVVRANFHRWEYATWYSEPKEVNVADHFARRYSDLPKYRRAVLCCVAGHDANYLIPALDRPFRVFTMLRDPVERVVSLYHYNLLQADRATTGEKLTDLDAGTQMGLVLRERGWTLRDIYLRLGDKGEGESKLHALFFHYFNGQSRGLLGPHLDTSSMDYTSNPGDDLVKRLERLLEEHYVVGVQGEFSRSLGLYARSFGWKRLWIPQLNRSGSADTRGVDQKTLELIRSHNQLDDHIYRAHVERVAALDIPTLSGPPVRARLRGVAGRRL